MTMMGQGVEEKIHSQHYKKLYAKLPLKVKLFTSETSKRAPRSKIAIDSKVAPYKIVFHGYVICAFINYVI